MKILTASPTAKQIDTALLILRVAIGIVFFAHGYQKVFTYGFGGVTGAFAGMGIPLAGTTAPLVSIVELVGGAALILGAMTRLFALLLTFTMLGAIFLVHLPEGFFLPKGYEFAFALGAALVALVLTGAGRYSVDDSLSRRKTL